MNRITEKLSLLGTRREKALALFLTAGYPRLDATVDLVAGFEQAGADIMEIGIPFSDPLADGPVIQQASAVALKNGVTLSTIIEIVRSVRKKSTIPIALMGYINPILRFGAERFFGSAAEAGADGIILPELPLEEAGRFADTLARCGLARILLVTPTSPAERIRRIDEASEGFLYCVSTTGVTGVQGAGATDEYLSQVKHAAHKNPVLVGFGIQTPDDAKRYARITDGVIVGSALLRRLVSEEREATMEWVRSLKSCMNGSQRP